VSLHKVEDLSFVDYKKTEFFLELEKGLKQGWPTGCHRCQNEESNGLISLRQRYNQRMSGEKDRLEFLELSISNHCNLTCKMCDNFSSSKWQTMLDTNPKLLDYDFGKDIIKNKDFSVNDIFKDLDLDFLNTVKYLGGEPFVTPELSDLIGFFEQRNIIDRINFRCNTNCTFYPRKLIDRLLQFKSVRIDLSVDGIDDLCNFVRTGEHWSKVSSVIDQWLALTASCDKVTLVLHHTSQALNIHQFDMIKEFAEQRQINFSYSILSHPRYLSFEVLPKEYIHHIIDKKILTDIKMIDILKNTAYDDECNRKFKSYIEDTDRILKTDINEVIPDLWNRL
jgi:organic radical activating enzyme